MSLTILDDLDRTSLIMSSEHEYTIVHMHFLRGCRVNVDLYRDMHWAILIKEVPAEDLFTELYNNQSKFKGNMLKAISTLLHKHARDMPLCKDDCDVTLLYSIIRNLQTTLPPPTQGWGIEPLLSTHISITDDVERMRLSRNKFYGHTTRPSLNETEFKTLMDEAEAIVERVGQHLHVNGSENPFKMDLGDIRNKDITDQWEIQINELSKIEIENRERIEVNREGIEELTERVEEIAAAAGCAVNTYKDDSSKYSIHEAKKLIKDGERQGYYIKGQIVKKYSLLKQKMKKEDTTILASALVLHEKITDNQMEAVEERPRRRDAVETLLKLILGGDSEMHTIFVSECERRENVKVVCDTYLSEKEMDAFIGLELMDKGRCRRPHDETKLTFTDKQKCLLITALNHPLNSEVSNDELLSRLCISVDEHTKVWNCEMGNEKRINKLIATMQECDSSVLQTLGEILDSSKMTHIADSLTGRIVSDDQSSYRSPLATLKQECSRGSHVQAQVDCHLKSITKGSITFHLTANSNKWKKLKEKCSSGTISSLIEQLYQILASNGDLGIGEYRMNVTIYTITHLGTKEAEKAFLHLSTDVDPAATGSDDGYDQLDVRFNPMLDHYDILVEELDVTRRLLKSLVENECLADGDIEESLAIDSRSDQAEHLFNKLIGHGQKCYNILQEHLRVTNKDVFNVLQERDINLKRKKFYAGTFVLQVNHTSTPEGDTTTDKATVTCIDIINPTCHFQSNEGTDQTLDTDSHDKHAEEERLKDETRLDQDDKWKAALVKAYESLMNEMSTETAVYMTNLLLENKSISEDQSHIIKKCGFRREIVGNLLHCVLRGDQKTWDVFRSGLGIILEDITTTDQQEFLRLENLTFENGKRTHHQEPRLRLNECDVVTLTCNFLSNVTAIDKLNDCLLSKFYFSRQEHEAILNCDRDILYRADLFISTMEQCSENIVEDFLSLLEDVGLDDVVGQLKHHVAKERHEKGSFQQDDMDTGSTSLKRKLLALRQYLLRKFGFYLDHKTGLGRIELVPRDSEAWTNLEKSGEIENLVPLLYSNLLTHPLLQSSENRVLSLKIYIHDNHCRSRKFVSGRTATIDLIETTDEYTTASCHGLLIDERHNQIEMHEELLLEGIEIASLLGDFKKEGVLGHIPDIEAAGTRSRSKEVRHLLRRMSPTGRKVYNVLLLNVKKNDPAIFHELGALEKLASEPREYFTAEVQATVLMQGDLRRRTLQVNTPTFHFKLQGNDEDRSGEWSPQNEKDEEKRILLTDADALTLENSGDSSWLNNRLSEPDYNNWEKGNLKGEEARCPWKEKETNRKLVKDFDERAIETTGNKHQKLSDPSSNMFKLPVSPDAYDSPFLSFPQPVEIGAFSQDIQQKFYNDRSQLQYYIKPPNTCRVNFDLRVGYEDMIRKDESCKAFINDILHWIIANPDKCLVKNSDSGEGKDGPTTSRKLNTDFVCFRGLLTRFLCAPYENNDGLLVAITLYNDTYYLCEYDTDEKKKHCENQTEHQDKMCCWGWKFEQYLKTDSKDGKPDPVKKYNNIEAFATVVQSRLNSHSIVFAGEVDALSCDERGKEHYVEFKVTRKIDNPRQDRNFQMYKLIKWWAQSVLVGIPEIVCGFRDDVGIVHRLESFKTLKIPESVKDQKGCWKPNVCFNFLDRLLSFIKEKVTVDDHRIVYLLEWKPKEDLTLRQLQRGSEFVFLPDWYTDVSSSEAATCIA